jgi:hypothetical protein
MIDFKLDIETEPIKTILEKAPAGFRDIINSEFADWALKTVNKAKARAPYRTGNLKQSTFPKKETDFKITVFTDTTKLPNPVTGEVSNVEYAKYVEPPPLGVEMTRPMKRTMFLYNSAMEELEMMTKRLQTRLLNYLTKEK